MYISISLIIIVYTRLNAYLCLNVEFQVVLQLAVSPTYWCVFCGHTYGRTVPALTRARLFNS